MSNLKPEEEVARLMQLAEDVMKRATSRGAEVAEVRARSGSELTVTGYGGEVGAEIRVADGAGAKAEVVTFALPPGTNAFARSADGERMVLANVLLDAWIERGRAGKKLDFTIEKWDFRPYKIWVRPDDLAVLILVDARARIEL